MHGQPLALNRIFISMILTVTTVLVHGCGPGQQAHNTTLAPPPATNTTGNVDEAPNRVGNTTVAQDSVAPARPPIRRAGRTVDITFDDLALEMPLGTLFDSEILTPRVKELDGKHVRLRGFIFAGGVFQSTGIKNFLFVMNTQCKFGPQGLAYCVILVDLAEGVTANFTTYPITVEGQLSVRPYNADGFTWSVYHMRGTKVY